jgi:hypothetical protein
VIAASGMRQEGWRGKIRNLQGHIMKFLRYDGIWKILHREKQEVVSASAALSAAVRPHEATSIFVFLSSTISTSYAIFGVPRPSIVM